MTDTRSLSERLEDHAECHANVSPYDDEQAAWEADLREAAAILRRVEAAPVVVARDHEGAMPGDLIYVGKRLPLSWVGKRVALVEVGEHG